MKIEKLILKNFAALDVGLNTKSICIDFSKSLHNICLFIGPNGSGKTTILSLLTPFADLGNLDVRNGNNLILKNKDGYKEIHIRNGKDYYVIKHYYTHHKDKNHSVKSYIEKNGVELNVNGNVTSFKEFVKEELFIEPDYLKLIRLGENVTSLIDLTTTERKNYMGKLMDDIGIYLMHYKSINSKLRQLDEMIAHTIDKINKIDVVDKKELEKEIDVLSAEISRVEKLYIDENNNIAVYENTISNIDDYMNIKENLTSITKKYNKMLNIMEKKDQLSNLDIEYYTKEIHELEKKILSNENEIKANTLVISTILNHIDSEQEQLRSYNVQLNKEKETDNEIRRIDKSIAEMRGKLNKYEDLFKDFTPKFSKTELETFIVFLKNTQQILSRTYEFGKLPITRVVDLMKDKKNVMNYINSHLLDLDDEVDQKGSLFISKIAKNLLFNGNQPITIACNEECNAKTLFIQLQNLLQNAVVTDKKEDSYFYHDMEFIYQNLITILPKFSDYKDIIDNLPDDIKKDFEIDNVYNNIKNLDMIYNEKKINELLSIITEYDNYLSLLEKYKDTKNNLSTLASFSNLSQLDKQIRHLSKDIEDNKDKMNMLKLKNDGLKEENKELNNSLEILIETKEALEKFDEVRDLYKKINADYDLFIKTSEKLNSSKISVAQLKVAIDDLNNKLKNKENDLFMYKSLNKELKKFNKIYEEMTFVKYSFSSKEGIPLHKIGRYLSNTEKITNELLDIAYDGKIFIEKFNITASEFSIPFYNRGVRLEDVKYASQGELSFLSIALSFALSSQAFNKYNIMLLDEIDGALDTRNREKFIEILENQIKRINSEQNFLITHNSMFSSYPVDIIDLSGKKDDTQYPLANFIDVIIDYED